MKKFCFKLAVAGYVIGLFMAFLTTAMLNAYRPTEVFVMMSCCALTASLCCSKVQRWFTVAALLFALGGSINCWHYNQRIHESVTRMLQSRAAERASSQTHTNR